LLSSLSSGLELLYAGCLAFYLLLVMATSALISWRERDLRMMVWSPLVFVAVHVGAGLGILTEFVRPGRPPAWRPSTVAQPKPAAAPRRAA
jgi:hypothetical protein